MDGSEDEVYLSFWKNAKPSQIAEGIKESWAAQKTTPTLRVLSLLGVNIDSEDLGLIAEALRESGQNKNVQVLTLSDNPNLTNVQALGKCEELPELLELHIESCGLEGELFDPEKEIAFPKLQKLNISHSFREDNLINALSGPTPVKISDGSMFCRMFPPDCKVIYEGTDFVVVNSEIVDDDDDEFEGESKKVRAICDMLGIYPQTKGARSSARFIGVRKPRKNLPAVLKRGLVVKDDTREKRRILVSWIASSKFVTEKIWIVKKNKTILIKLRKGGKKEAKAYLKEIKKSIDDRSPEAIRKIRSIDGFDKYFAVVPEKRNVAVHEVVDQIIRPILEEKNEDLPWTASYAKFDGKFPIRFFDAYNSIRRAEPSALENRDVLRKFAYKGVNNLALKNYISAAEKDFGSLRITPMFLTWKQAQKISLAARPKPGSKAVRLLKYIPENAITGKRAFTVSFEVFSVDVFDDLVFKEKIGTAIRKIRRVWGFQADYAQASTTDSPGQNLWERIKDVHRQTAGDLPEIIEEPSRTIPAYYPTQHTIKLPGNFSSDDDLWKTFFHELTHSTKKHLKREFKREIYDADHTDANFRYSNEELVAEIGAFLLMSEAYPGQTVAKKENHRAYVRGWAKKLEKQPWRLAQAARLADNAVNFLLYGDNNNRSGKEEAEDDEEDVLKKDDYSGYFDELKKIVDGDDNNEMESDTIDSIVEESKFFLLQAETKQALPPVIRTRLQALFDGEQPKTRAELVRFLQDLKEIIDGKFNPSVGCALPRCDRPAQHVCANCRTTPYCSARCQRADWASHNCF